MTNDTSKGVVYVVISESFSFDFDTVLISNIILVKAHRDKYEYDPCNKTSL